MKIKILSIFNIIVLIFVLISKCFAQTNFTLEWESPTNLIFKGLTNFERYNSIPEIVFQDNQTLKVYDGASKVVKYSYTNSDSSNFTNYGLINSSTIDVNNDGINDFVLYKFILGGSYTSNIKVINGSNGQILFQNTFPGIAFTISTDIDGDGWIELCIYNTESSIGTPFFKIYSTASHVSVNENIETNQQFNLKQNYPNPFNPSTTIEYTISKNSDVQLIIYDITGKELMTLVNENKPEGIYKINLDGYKLASGSYFYQLLVNGNSETKKMILIK
jgi:hypothetical protein